MPPKTLPSQKPPPPPTKKNVPRRVQPRIAGIGSSPASVQFRPSTPVRASTPARSQTPAGGGRRCPNPKCPNPKVDMTDEANFVCLTCGAMAVQDSNLVSEQQFNQEPGGRITAQGQTIGVNQTHQRAQGAPSGTGKASQDESPSFGQASRAARLTMRSFCPPLNIPESEVEAGMIIWKMAYSNHKFVQGRGLSNVATVCFYLALRRRKEQIQGVARPKYAIMLLDFAEIGNLDVFLLGRMYTDLVRSMSMIRPTDNKPDLTEQDRIDLLAHGPEVLVDRFVDSLEFPPQYVKKIKDDAIRIVARMKRDWMSDGRRPAGVCGAAVILAARMNNHRRTTREVILTAKVTEITLNKRLEEFSDLRSSQLSIEDFRNNQILNAVEAADPPAYTRAHNPPKPQKRKRGRPRKNGQEPETAAEMEEDATDQQTQDGQPQAKRARVDAEGFAIPALPQRPSSADTAPDGEGSTASSRRPGRPPGAKNWRAPPVSPAEQAIEDELQRDIDLTLQENPELDPTPVVEHEVIPPGEKLPPSIKAKLEQVKALSATRGNTNAISLAPEIEDDEFEDDEEVAICVLTEEERRMKEIVWVTKNADWLRQQHAKRIKRELKEAELIAKGIDPAVLDRAKQRKDGKPLRRKDGHLRVGQSGDVSYLAEMERRQRQGSAAIENGSQGREGSREASLAEEERSRTRSPSESPFPAMGSAADSVHLFIQARGNAFSSRRLNQSAIDEVYTFRRASSSTPSDSRSPTQTRSGGSARHEDHIFGAMGAKDSGLLRSKSSLSAERRQDKVREMKRREGSGESGATGPLGRAGSGESVSTSPETEAGQDRSGSAISEEDVTPGPGPVPPGTQSQPSVQIQQQIRSQPTSQQHTPTSTQTQLDDGSIEEVIGSNPVSRSQSDTPGPGDGLISLRDDVDIDDDEEGEDDDDIDEDEYDDDDEPEAEPDLDDVFAGRTSRRR